MVVETLLDSFFAQPVFETERMVAGVWHPDLAELAFEIYGDSRVTEHIRPMATTNVIQTRAKLETIIERNKKWTPPIGSWPMFRKSDRALVGTALIKPLPGAEGVLTDDIEIGWHLGYKFWGQGYASEFGRRLLEIGFDDLDQDVLWAVVSTLNIGSQNVAKRIGMTHVGQTNLYYDEMRLELFEMPKPRAFE